MPEEVVAARAMRRLVRRVGLLQHDPRIAAWSPAKRIAALVQAMLVISEETASAEEHLRTMQRLVAAWLASPESGRPPKDKQTRQLLALVASIKAAHPSWTPSEVNEEAVTKWNERHPKAKPLSVTAMKKRFARLRKRPE